MVVPTTVPEQKSEAREKLGKDNGVPVLQRRLEDRAAEQSGFIMADCSEERGVVA